MRKIGLLLLVLCTSIVFSACNPLESKVKSGIQVLTNDIPSSLFLNDEYLDKTPYINKTIKPGVYTLRIEPDDQDLTTYETTVTLNKGVLTVLTWKPGLSPETSGGIIYELEPLESKSQAEISFTTIPDNAIISFDGGESQFSPLLLQDIEPGHHEFEISLPSYETQKHVINVVKGHKLLASVKMAKSNETTVVDTDDKEDVKDTTTNQINEEQTDDEDEVEIDNSDLTIIEDSPELTNNETEDSTDKEETEIEDGEEEIETISGDTVLIKPTNYFKDDVEVLRVRDAAGSSGKELGFAEVGKEYKYLDEEKNGWYKIEFDNDEGWVSGKYAELSED